jgi:hypothetical protein
MRLGLGRRWIGAAVFGIAMVAAAGIATAQGGGAPSAASQRQRALVQQRTGGVPADVPQLTQGVAPSAAAQRARERLRAGLGRTGFVTTDARTGAVRSIGRLDGFLTGPSGRSPQDVALGWARDHLDALGLRAADLAALRLARAYRSIDGVTHLIWEQRVDGVPLVDADLRANVTDDGRLDNIGGSPRGGLSLNAATPAVQARGAYSRLLRSAGSRKAAPAVQRQSGRLRATDFAGDGEAGLVAYTAGSGARLAWRVQTPASPDEDYDGLIDAQTGQVIRRSNLVKFANNALVRDNVPGAPVGGAQVSRPIGQWLTPAATTLTGNNAHAFVDADDDVGTQIEPDRLVNTFEAAVPAAGEVHPNGAGDWSFPTTFFSYMGGFCPPNPTACTWNHTVVNSWQTNKNQATTQLFYFVNKYHDHLAAPPIGFNAASGNFQRVNAGGQGVGGDPVLAQADDGANTDGGLPDEAHQDNANFDTLPDGTPGRMQMYLFEPIDVGGGLVIPFGAVNGSDDPEVVYHEFTHGLSNRLITDAQGFGALDDAQSGAMGEAWSDWYAEDFLNAQGLIPDAPAPGDVDEGDYVDNGFNLIRSEPMDCRPGDDPAVCPGSIGAGSGGYTYGDFGRILAFSNTCTLPEVHADGEIWGQTLWELRQLLVARHGLADGSRRAEQIVTGGMRLGPAEPTFLDERNAILQADAVAHNGDQDLIWQAFAARGMGYFASTSRDQDTSPHEDFSLPPAAGGRTGSIRGVVRDDSDRPVAGALVGLGGHDAPGVGPALQAVSHADGSYVINGVPQGQYETLTAHAPVGFADAQTGPITVGGAPVTRDLTVRRNYADLGAGASLPTRAPLSQWTNFRDESAEGCGPRKLFDSDLGTAVKTSAPTDTDDPTTPFDETVPRYITVQLSKPVNGAEIWIDPTAHCGGLDGNALGSYAVQVSTNGVTFADVAEGDFGTRQLHQLNRVHTLPGVTMPNGIQYVRLVAFRTVGGPDVEGDPLSDGGFLGISELDVFARPSLPRPATPTPTPSPTATPTPTPTLARLKASLARTAKRLKVSKRGTVTVKVRCVRATTGTLPRRCRGTVAVTGRLPGAKRATKLGARTFSIAANRVVSVKVKLSKRALKALRRRSLSAKLTVRVRSTGARARTTTKRVKLLRRKPTR